MGDPKTAGGSGFAVSPAAMQAHVARVRKRLPKVIKASIQLTVAIATGYFIWNNQRHILALLNVLASVHLPNIVTRLLSDPFVLAGCGLVTVTMFVAVSKEIVVIRRLKSLLQEIQRGFEKHSTDEFSEFLTTTYRRCGTDLNFRHFELNRQLQKFIEAIEPRDYDPRLFKPLTARHFLTPHTIYRSALLSAADNLVRLALFMTFLALTWALVSTAQQLPKFELLEQQGATDANAIVAQTSKLVADLISVASFKFFISAFGLLASILTRTIGTHMESSFALHVVKFSDAITEASEVFLSHRARGTLATKSVDRVDLPAALHELALAVGENTSVSKDIIGLVMGGGTRGRSV